MAGLHCDGSTLRLALSLPERAVSAQPCDWTVPLDAVRAVRVVRDGLGAAHGIGLPGLTVPGMRKVGVIRHHGHRWFAAVRRGQPAVAVRLAPGEELQQVLIGTDDAYHQAASLAAALPPQRRDLFLTLDPQHHRLAASLRVPEAPAPVPAALLLPGSGPIDRDGDAAGAALSLQLELAEALAASGIASLRYDRRGVGDGGDWRTATLDDNTADARTALAALAAAPGIDADRIIVIGHSEGSLHALRLAVSADPGPAAAVLLSASGEPGGAALVWQSEQLAATLPSQARAVLRLARLDLPARTRAAHDRLRATTGATARLGGRSINAGWFRQFLDYDPRPDLERLAVPTLALTGTADLQTNPEAVRTIADLARGPVTAVNPVGISHLLRRASDPPTLQDYRRQLREPADEQVLARIVGWLADQGFGGPQK